MKKYSLFLLLAVFFFSVEPAQSKTAETTNVRTQAIHDGSVHALSKLDAVKCDEAKHLIHNLSNNIKGLSDRMITCTTQGEREAICDNSLSSIKAYYGHLKDRVADAKVFCEDW